MTTVTLDGNCRYEALNRIRGQEQPTSVGTAASRRRIAVRIRYYEISNTSVIPLYHSSVIILHIRKDQMKGYLLKS
jgi:hypothetical protein